ncbi:hypothetical protein NEOKW01_0551 [Nematocida sp. AWRm80]|nr:hypothetical protein NEOKW01_0551 [Nematocida sp. AWRm80]
MEYNCSTSEYTRIVLDYYRKDSNWYLYLTSQGYTPNEIKRIEIELDKYPLEYFKKTRIDKRSIGFEEYHDKRISKDYVSDKNHNEFDKRFLKGYRYYCSGEYLECREIIEQLLKEAIEKKTKHVGCKLHLLSLGVAAAHRMGGYFDALHLVELGETLSKAIKFAEGVDYFREMKWIIESTAGIPTVYAYKEVSLLSNTIVHTIFNTTTIDNKQYRYQKYNSNTTLLRDIKIYDTREREKNNTSIIDVSEYIQRIKHIKDICDEITPILVYTIDKCLSIGVIYNKDSKSKMNIIKTKIQTESLLEKLTQINQENREVLRMTCESEEEKQEWWNRRIALDKRIKKELDHIDLYLKKFADKNITFQEEIALVMEDSLGNIPMEMCDLFRNNGIFRSISLNELIEEHRTRKKQQIFKATSTQSNKQQFFYVLNPENNLHRTEERLEEVISTYLPHSLGIKGRIPRPFEIEENILSHDIFLYFGHGGGEKFFTPRRLTQLYKQKLKEKERLSENASSLERDKAILSNTNGIPYDHRVSDKDIAMTVIDFSLRSKCIFLFGCASAKMYSYSSYNIHSTSISYLLHPLVSTVVGTLWDVTDKDLDIMSIGIIEALNKRKQPLSYTLNHLKHSCKLKYLNGSALIMYGRDI